jgi:hypothetical protein
MNKAVVENHIGASHEKSPSFDGLPEDCAPGSRKVICLLRCNNVPARGSKGGPPEERRVNVGAHRIERSALLQKESVAGPGVLGLYNHLELGQAVWEKMLPVVDNLEFSHAHLPS